MMRPIYIAGGLLLLALILAVAGGSVYTILERKRVRAAYAPSGQFISVEGTSWHYVDAGQGRPVVLIHGNAGFIQDWDALLPALTAGHRVLAFDRPGHGSSARASGPQVTPDMQARMLHDALARLRVECPVLVGFSWGGGLSLIYALKYPRETCGLVLIAPRAFPDNATPSAAYRLGRTPVLGDLFRHSVMLPIARRIIAARVTSGYAPDAPDPGHLAAAIDLWSRPGQAHATVWDSKNLDDALRLYNGRYAEITAPVTILVGDHDGPERESLPLARRIRGAEIEVLPRTGHFVARVRPAAVVDAVDTVLAKRAP